MLIATLNEAIPLQLLAADGRDDLYARLNIYNSSNGLIDTLQCSYVSEGLYTTTWIPSMEGYYNIIGTFYFDPQFTVEADYEKSGDLIEVNNNKTNITRLLGLQHENSVIDQQGYDEIGNLTFCRIRCYDSKEHALLSGSVGLTFVYNMNAQYINTQMQKYSLVRIV